jgi:hypothetical protein
LGEFFVAVKFEVPTKNCNRKLEKALAGPSAADYFSAAASISINRMEISIKREILC